MKKIKILSILLICCSLVGCSIKPNKVPGGLLPEDEPELGGAKAISKIINYERL